MLINATTKDIIEILKWKHKELIENIGLGLVTLSVPLNTVPTLKVTVTSKPEHTPPQWVTIEYCNNHYIVQIQVVLGREITPC